MVWSLSAVQYYTAVFLAFAVVLVALAVLTILWRQLWLGLLAITARTAYKVGLYEPSARRRTVHDGKRDSSFLTFSKALRAFSRIIPGDPNRHPHTVVLPVTLLGIPTLLLAFALLWAVPLYVLGYVVGTTSGSWTIVIGFLGMFAYIAAVVMGLKLLARVPALAKRVWRTPAL